MFHSTIRFAAAALVAGLVAAAGPVRAQDSQTSTRMVQAGDLDLHTGAGQSMLHHRIAIAARHVCGDPAVFGSPDDASYSSCVVQAERQALSRVTTTASAGSRYTVASLSN